jgi:hypothetical protein
MTNTTDRNAGRGEPLARSYDYIIVGAGAAMFGESASRTPLGEGSGCPQETPNESQSATR